MQHHSFKRGSFTLLASAMAAATSGQVLAETAGKVSFVTGNVTATTSDGASRTLRRGDAINGGDRIETRGGRLQIRFTDGGFVALQPNTVFGVDQYLYANKAPEDSSLFFSLLRGGMRTITGAIGKVNKQSYKVRTPVATIGIRGTGYRAIADNDRTLVSVGHGFVNVENALGNITAGAGQNILATNDLAPGLSREAAGIPATGPEGDSEEGSAGEENTGSDTARFGEQITDEGISPLARLNPNGPGYLPSDMLDTVIPPAATVLADTNTATNTPLYSMASPFIGPTSSQVATFDQSAGNPLTLTESSSTLFDSGTLQFHGVTTVGGISWGEYTNGEYTLNNSPQSLGANEYKAYVVGVTPSFSPSFQTASYSLINGTAPRLDRTTGGTLNDFTIDVDFVLSQMNVLLDLTISGTQFVAQGSNLFTDVSDEGLFNLYLNAIDMSGTGACTQVCFCTTSISGFFSSAQPENQSTSHNQIGAAYTISTDLGEIAGSAGLGLISGSMAHYVEGTYASPIGTSSSFVHPNAHALFDANGLRKLSSISGDPWISAGSLQYHGIGAEGDLRWGEFTNGNADYENLSGNGIYLSSAEFLPYIFGTQAASLLGSGTATYGLQANSYTTPRLSQSGEGALTKFNITINFDLALLSLEMDLSHGTDLFEIDGSNISVPDLFFNGAFSLDSSTSGLSTSSITGACSGSGCNATIQGFFAGTTGTQIGTAYSIGTNIGTITGVAALGMSGPITPSTTLPDGQFYTLAKTEGNALSGSYPYGPSSAAINATFDSSGNLASAYSSLSAQHILTNGNASVSDVGNAKTLSWGRYTSPPASFNVTVDGIATETNGSIHYVIGQETPSLMMSNILSLGSGSATYGLSGHTTPSSTSGLGNSLSGALTLDFSTSSLEVDMSVAMGASTYTVADSILLSAGQATFQGAGLATTRNGSACPSGCSTNINGFFSGHQAQRAGLVYQINDSIGETIKGAAVFTRNTPITLPNGEVFLGN